MITLGFGGVLAESNGLADALGQVLRGSAFPLGQYRAVRGAIATTAAWPAPTA